MGRRKSLFSGGQTDRHKCDPSSRCDIEEEILCSMLMRFKLLKRNNAERWHNLYVICLVFCISFILFYRLLTLPHANNKDNDDHRPIHMLHIESEKNRNSSKVVEFCSLYSVAKLHPTRTVYFHTNIKKITEVEYFKSLPNVVIMPVNLTMACSDTPAEVFYKNILLPSASTTEIGLIQLVDVLRLCLLHKYGGTYVDTDMITVAEFPESWRNFAFLNSRNTFGNAFMDFDKHDQRVTSMLQRIPHHYKADTWGGLGEELITPVLKNHSHGPQLNLDEHYVNYFPPYRLFSTANTGENLHQLDIEIRNGQIYAVHGFRGQLMYFDKKKELHAESMLGLIMKRQCPVIYESERECDCGGPSDMDKLYCCFPMVLKYSL